MVRLVIRPMTMDCLHRGSAVATYQLGPTSSDSDEPGTGRADAQAIGRRSGIGAGYEAGLARTKDGAGGRPAEEQTCARGRGMRLIKIGESRTRMRGRDDNFRMDPLSGI